jgi:hypothetical protein
MKKIQNFKGLYLQLKSKTFYGDLFIYFSAIPEDHWLLAILCFALAELVHHYDAYNIFYTFSFPDYTRFNSSYADRRYFSF